MPEQVNWTRFVGRDSAYLRKRILPQRGSGPSERIRESEYFKIIMHTRTPAKIPYQDTVAAQGEVLIQNLTKAAMATTANKG